MADLRPFREIEKLVQDSVFHPSPRHHLRERVLRNAVEAKHRQKLWRRFLIASAALSGTLVLAFVAIRVGTSGPTVTTETGPVRVQIDSPGHNLGLPAAPQRLAAPGASLGEELYFHAAGFQDAGFQDAGSPHAARRPTGAER